METRFEGHTPGPWEVDHNVTNKGVLGVVADAAPCVIAHGFSEKYWPRIANANAALIAAAPALLARVQELSTTLEMVGAERDELLALRTRLLAENAKLRGALIMARNWIKGDNITRQGVSDPVGTINAALGKDGAE